MKVTTEVNSREETKDATRNDTRRKSRRTMAALPRTTDTTKEHLLRMATMTTHMATKGNSSEDKIIHGVDSPSSGIRGDINQITTTNNGKINNMEDISNKTLNGTREEARSMNNSRMGRATGHHHRICNNNKAMGTANTMVNMDKMERVHIINKQRRCECQGIR